MLDFGDLYDVFFSWVQFIKKNDFVEGENCYQSAFELIALWDENNEKLTSIGDHKSVFQSISTCLTEKNCFSKKNISLSIANSKRKQHYFTH